jgi:Alpha-glutamyl/putrescinyl thymine pyrophosphorylase clade 3
MPTFCRHNRLLQNCTICAREQNFEARPVVSSSAPKATQPHEQVTGERPARAARTRSPAGGGNGRGVRVRRLARGIEDGFRSPLLPGLKSSEDADRLAEEIAFAAWRLELMEAVAAGAPVAEDHPIWSEIAGPGDLEQRTELAFSTVVAGPRGVGSEERAEEALIAYRAWADRAGSQQAAFTGEAAWTPERRFERVFERLQFGGLGRDTRFELLTLLGRLGLYDLRAGKLFLTGENEATWAAKRALGIGDPLLLERRAADLAQACQAPLEALDLAFHNWGSGARVTDGLPEDAEGDELVLEQARSVFGL